MLTAFGPTCRQWPVRVTDYAFSCSRAVGALVLLLGLLLRFTVPVGYMLSPDGALAVVPCPAFAPVAADVPPDGGHAMHANHALHGGHGDEGVPTQHDPSQHKGDTCPYGAISAPVLPASPVALADPLPAHEPPQPTSGESIEVAALAAPPPPSRGPPRLS
jgi:hypothetical protein